MSRIMKSPILFLSFVVLLALSLVEGCTPMNSQSNRSGAEFRMEKEEFAGKEMIHVETPQPGTVVRSPLTVRGKAKGPWYFEGDFPLLLKDNEGEILARGVASAKGEWMTTDFVPFVGKLVFTAPEGKSGDLILQKDNPSGLRELDDTLTIPVRFQ